MNIALVGYGTMGHLIKEAYAAEIKYIIADNSPYNTHSLFDITGNIDCIIDFSNPYNLDMIYDYASLNKIPVVIATTGYSLLEEEKIKKLSKQTAVLKSANFSPGITILNKIIKEITPILMNDYDIEILEFHHNKKLDCPSGTAKLLYDSINDIIKLKPSYGRYGKRLRDKSEIGFHSVRGGNIIGKHEILYLSSFETIKIKHSAESKMVFVKGAYLACKFLKDKASGLYSMEDVYYK